MLQHLHLVTKNCSLYSFHPIFIGPRNLLSSRCNSAFTSWCGNSFNRLGFCRQISQSSSALNNTLQFPKKRNPDPYEIFHLAHTANAAEIKTRYYELVKIYHPDKLEHPSAADQERFRKIVAAYDILGDKAKRNAYDHGRPTWVGHGAPQRRPHGSYTGWRPMNARDWESFYENQRSDKNDAEDSLQGDIKNNMTALIAFGAVILYILVNTWRFDRSSRQLRSADTDRQLKIGQELRDIEFMANNLSPELRKELFLGAREGQYDKVQMMRDIALDNKLKKELNQEQQQIDHSNDVNQMSSDVRPGEKSNKKHAKIRGRSSTSSDDTVRNSDDNNDS